MKVFQPFRLDTVNHCLWRTDERVPLTPKAFDVLRYLVEHADRLVTQNEILEALWPETYVNPEVIKKYVLGIRKVLGDQPEKPAFIATFPKRGYQFIAAVREESTASPSGPFADAKDTIVGREDALAQLGNYLTKALNGQRQVIFVTGEAGIGKTTLLDVFHQRAVFRPNLRIARGQCVEGFGGKEAYYPVLEALGQLIRDAGDSPVVQILIKRAPTWLIQFSSLVKGAEQEALQREVLGTTRERMVREICEALEAVTVEHPLILILEDLHWVDVSTLDVISALARRRGPAKLILLGTYRPADVVILQSPLKALKQDLLVHRLCDEVLLERLEQTDVSQYLDAKFATGSLPSGLSNLIYQHSGGNPLFMAAIVQDLLKDGLIAQEQGRWTLTRPLQKIAPGIPDTLQQMIELQFELLSMPEQRILKSASVAGERFSVWTISSTLELDPERIENLCEELVEKKQFIRSAGIHELANGEFSAHYEFRHSLYREFLYRRLSEVNRSKLHRAIGERGEELYRERAREIAAELATHFERGRDYKRAAKYFQQAADNAIRRFAYQEAVGLSRRGLELLARLPDTAERAYRELCLQLTLGVPLIATEGYATPDAGSAYLRARELCQQLGETKDISEVHWGLWTFYTLRADLGIAREIAEEFLRLSERLPYPGLAMRGHWALGINFMHFGEFAPSLEHFEKALLLCDHERHLDDAVLYAQNPGVAIPCFAAWSLWFLGQPDRALGRIGEALTLALELSEPHGLAHALFFAAILHQLRGEWRMALEHAEAAIAVSREHGLVLYQAMATVTRGWALTKQGLQEESIVQMRQGIVAHQATGTEVILPHFLALLVEALHTTGQVEEGLCAVEEALAVVHRNGECYYQAELYRLKGELLLTQSAGRGVSRAAMGRKTMVEAEPPAIVNAESCFSHSIKIAQRQRAKSLEIRAVVSLARLYQKQCKQQKARCLLAPIYARFTEGFNTVDVREAKTLLDELS
jgi:DNA-binding winged helix-turn-helix (wHTH) protein/predicted ATPase